MSFQVSRWAWNVRGLTSREHHVLLLLADQADADGFISKLSHATIRNRCGFTRQSRHSQRILRTLLEKGFLKRAPRYGAHGNQISNAYRLDLARFHPDDAAGKLLWREARDVLCSGRPDRFVARLEAHAEGSTAYFRSEDRVLLVWLSNKYARQFFFDHLGELLEPLRAHRRHPIADCELLTLDTPTA